MLQLEDAQKKILELIEPLSTETVSLRNAFRRVPAQDISSPIDLPPFDNSAMDGYAAQSKDLVGATPETPRALRLIGKVAAGESFSGKIESGTCVRIFTGSPLPTGADGVAMQEDTRLEAGSPNAILFTDTIKPWENVRFRGEDVKAGTPLAHKGEPLTVGQISLLAACGLAEISVTRKPLIGLLATGTELIESGQPLAPGQIYESNRAGIGALIENAGAISKTYPLVADNLDATVAALEQAFTECDGVVTSGGVSVGEYDFIKAAFEKLGGELSFWKVSIRPGKPFVFGRLRGKYFFGLPGNPVSAMVTFCLLVRPALARLQGAKDCRGPSVRGVLAEPLSNNGDRRHFVRVRIDDSGEVHGAGIQASHILSALARANGLVDVGPNTTLAAGTAVSVLTF